MTIDLDKLEQVAYVIYGISASGKHFIKDVKEIPDDDKTGEWRSDDGSLGQYWAGNEPLFRAAPVPAAAPKAALTPEQIDALARQHNLDGSMLVGVRHDYWRAFARSIEAASGPSAALVEALQRIIQVWPNTGKAPGWANRWLDAMENGRAALDAAGAEVGK